jgi:hypothetical protein
MRTIVMKRGNQDSTQRSNDGAVKISDVRRRPKAEAPRATYELEDSVGKPSRKSTRGSSNRMKAGQPQAIAARNASAAPSARAGKRRH